MILIAPLDFTHTILSCGFSSAVYKGPHHTLWAAAVEQQFFLDQIWVTYCKANCTFHLGIGLVSVVLSGQYSGLDT